MKRALTSILGGALAAGAAAADCVPSDINGSWKTYQSFGTLGYQHCGLLIRDNGNVLAGTSCRDSSGVGSQITGGRLTVAQTCRVSGSASNSFGPFVIDHAFMSPDKNTITGVGKDASGLPISFQAVRRPDWVGPR